MLKMCLFMIALSAQEDVKPLPESGAFMAEVRKKMNTDERLLSEYTYVEKQTSIKVDSKNEPQKTEVNIWEVFPGSPERVEYRRQIVKNGQKVSAEELGKQDREHRKKAEALQKKLSRTSPADLEKERARKEREEEEFIEDLFGVFEMRVVARETLRGRSTIVVAFEPRPTYRTRSKEAKHMRHFKGRAWFVENEHELARLELEVIEPVSIGLGILAKLQKGAKLSAERDKFNDETWLPMKAEINLDLRVLMLKGIRIRQFYEYSDHKKYSVDTILKFPDEVALPR